MRTFTLRQIASFFDFSLSAFDILVEGFNIDSRQVRSGQCFVALKGEKADGHFFLKEAKAKGASAGLVDETYSGPDFGLFLIRVKNPLEKLQKFASHVLAASKSRVVAVTGSIGKTTTKEFIKTILEAKYTIAASPGNSNSQVGLPLSILNHTTGNEEILILEMGMTEKGQISRLVEIAPPEVAVLTNVALVHACNFESIEDIARAKGEIFKSSCTQLGILHNGIPGYDEVVKMGVCQKVSYSINDLNFEFSLPGQHNKLNFLAAALVGDYFQLSREEIEARIPFLRLPEKRLQFQEKGGILFLNDSYNASEPSMKAALETLPEKGGSKIAVLGSMLELGKFSDECHARVGKHALDHVEQLYCLGAEWEPVVADWKKEGRRAEIFQDHSSIAAYLKQQLQPHDVVLLKGSHSKEMWKVLEEL